MLTEFKIRPVTRYIVTKYETTGPDENGKGSGKTSQVGEYNNPDVAYEVAYAVCRAEHERLGYMPGDERIQYPRKIEEVSEFKVGNVGTLTIDGRLGKEVVEKLQNHVKAILPELISKAKSSGRLL